MSNGGGTTYLILLTLTVLLVLPLATVLHTVTELGPAHTPALSTEELTRRTGGSTGNLPVTVLGC